LALTSPTSGGRSVGIVRLRTKAKEFSFLLFYSEGGVQYSFRISVDTQAILDEVFRCLPQSLNLSLTGYDCFLLKPLKFISHQS
jgi:hypothetical protein